MQHRVFADHYQFYLFDPVGTAYDTETGWNDDTRSRGYVVGKSTLGMATVGHMNDHRVDVYLTESEQEKGGCERFQVVEFDVQSGTIKITSPAYLKSDEPSATVVPGRYRVFIKAYNLGSESEEELSDAAHMSRLDLERYEIMLLKIS